MIGVVLRTYDGHGNIGQVDNVKGSITGIVPDRPGFGTYEVSPDCTGIARFQPGPGILIEERLVIVDNGREIRTMTLSRGRDGHRHSPADSHALSSRRVAGATLLRGAPAPTPNRLADSASLRFHQDVAQRGDHA